MHYLHAVFVQIQVTVLEMKELNERQKAEHAERMYNRVKDAMEEMQRRNQELEAKFAEVFFIICCSNYLLAG